uniref:Uncharacterized protein n=1 Tax=Arion vulgaris TaxID=1028688 RepID=A0A0B7BHC3_9EUPU
MSVHRAILTYVSTLCLEAHEASIRAFHVPLYAVFHVSDTEDSSFTIHLDIALGLPFSLPVQ